MAVAPSVFTEGWESAEPPPPLLLSPNLTKARRECAGWARRSVPPLLEGRAICLLAPSHQSGTGGGENGGDGAGER